MKSNRFLLALILAIAVVAFWFLGRPDNTSKLGNDAQALTGEILTFGPRPPGSEALNQVRSLLSKELEASGWVIELQEFERDTSVGKIKFANLRARFRHGDANPWQRKIDGLLCAHVDSKFYKDKVFLGADDAASACAALVVIAKHLAAEKPEQAAKLELVFFDGEEAFSKSMTALDGLYGSRHYANTWRTRDDKPKFGILLDMIGHKDLSIRIPSDSPKHLAELMFSKAKEQNVSSHFDTSNATIMDDHVPLNLIGIPTLDILGDFTRSAWWHTPGDNSDIISSKSLSISIAVTLGMLDELLNEK
ncbi:MAG: M28 family peptidase [Verrucomicrobiota bacterium]